MKLFIYPLLAAAVLSSDHVHAQVDTLFFNSKWKVTKDRDSFAYFRPQPVMKDGRYEVRDYFINGKLQMLGHYSANVVNLMSDDNIADEYRDGKFEYYYENGKLENEGECENGGRIGVWTYHYLDGKVRSTTQYKKGRMHGQYAQFDSLSGMPLFTGLYKNGYGVGTWTFFFNGSKQKRSEITLKNDIPNGRATYFDSLTGKRITSGLLKDGEKEGKWDNYGRSTGELIGAEGFAGGRKHGTTYFYRPGTQQKWLQTNFFNDSLHGKLITYYESGKVKRLEFYSSGHIMSSACYNEQGEQIECVPLVVEGKFSGDVMTYIGNNLRYPEHAKKNKLQGKVVVSFMLSPTGIIQYPVVNSGFDAACDAEALRLVAQMPPWEPEYVDGIPVESMKTLPIVFWLPD